MCVYFYLYVVYIFICYYAYALLILYKGGYGGFDLTDPRSDGGFHSYNDVWDSRDHGHTWNLLQPNANFAPRAWFGMGILSAWGNPKEDMSLRRVGKPPKMYLFGGGNIGYSGASSMRVTTMDAKLDAFCSEDGETWTQINYNEGGGSSTVTQYSTQVCDVWSI